MLRFGVFAAFAFAAHAMIFSPSTLAQQPPVIKDDTPSRTQAKPPALKNNNPARPGATPKPTPKPVKEEDEVITVETNLVTTPVSVLDRNGRFIPGLKKKDFKIFDNDVPQAVTYFQSEETPFTVVLLIDVSPSTRYKIDEIHFAALTFVNQLRPTDKVMVLAFDQRVRALTEEPTSDKQAIYAAIYSTRYGSGTSLYDAVSLVTEMELVKAPGRKAVVIFTDGVDTTSRQASFESSVAGIDEIDALIYPIRYNTIQGGGQVNMGVDPAIFAQLPPAARDLIARAGNSRASVGRGQSHAEYERGKQYLTALADNSGGRIFEAETITNLEAAFSGVAEELRRQYLIGYYPDNTGQPGERRSIKIKVTRPNTVIRAKRSYIVRELQSGLENTRDSTLIGKE